MATCDRHDVRLWAFSFGAALLLAAGVYGYAFLATPSNVRFSGFLVNTHDSLSYQAWSIAFAKGELTVENVFDIVPNPPAYFNLVWFLEGKLMRLTGLNFLAVHYAVGILAGGAMFWLLLALMRAVLPTRAAAWCAYLLAGFGGGFGWLVWPAGVIGTVAPPNLPVDLIGWDGYPFLAFLLFPHIALSYALLTLVYLLMHRAATGGGWLPSCLAGGAVLLLGFSHPYHFVTIAAVLGIWYLLLTAKHGRGFLRRWPMLIPPAVSMVPALLYFRHLFNDFPSFAYWRMSNICRSLPVHWLLLGFGFILLFAIGGTRLPFPLRAYRDSYLLPLVWAPVNLLLLYSYPVVPFEARLLQGLILPLAMLAAIGFFRLIMPLIDPESAEAALRGIREGEDVDGDSRVRGRTLAAILGALVICLPSHAVVIGNQLSWITRFRGPVLLSRWDNNISIPTAYLDALGFIKRNYGSSAVVLASPEVAPLVTGYDVGRTLLGHLSIAPAYPAKMEAYKEFYRAQTTDETRRLMLSTFGITILWFGYEDRAYGPFNPDAAPYLRKIFDNGAVRLYGVERGIV